MRYAWFVLALALSALAAWGGFVLTRHVTVAVDKWGNAAPDLKPTLDAISGPRGTLWQANKAIVKIGDAIVTTQMAERNIAPHTISAVDSLKVAAQTLSAASGALAGTANAATESAQALTVALGIANQTIGAAQPVLANSDAAVDDLRALLKNQAITATLTNVQSMTAQGSAILGDARMVADKARENYLKPIPWYLWPVKRSGQILDIGAAVARHAP
jgi:hypothetical protein